MTQKSQSTRSNIFEASQRLFLERNYADVTMDQIAASSGLTKGALYHHFTNKEQLYLEMMVEDLKEKQTLFFKASQSGKSRRERLENLTRVYLELPELKRDLIKLVRRDINVFDGKIRATLVRAYQEALPKIIEAILEQGSSSQQRFSREARMLSWFYVALVECTLGSFAQSAFSTHQEQIDYVLDFFFQGAQSGSSTKSAKLSKSRGAKNIDKKIAKKMEKNIAKKIKGRAVSGKSTTRKKGDLFYGESL